MTGEEMTSRSFPLDLPYFLKCQRAVLLINKPKLLTKRERITCTTDLSVSMKLMSGLSFFLEVKKPMVSSLNGEPERLIKGQLLDSQVTYGGDKSE